MIPLWNHCRFDHFALLSAYVLLHCGIRAVFDYFFTIAWPCMIALWNNRWFWPLFTIVCLCMIALWNHCRFLPLCTIVSLCVIALWNHCRFWPHFHDCLLVYDCNVFLEISNSTSVAVQMQKVVSAYLKSKLDGISLVCPIFHINGEVLNLFQTMDLNTLNAKHHYHVFYLFYKEVNPLTAGAAYIRVFIVY